MKYIKLNRFFIVKSIIVVIVMIFSVYYAFQFMTYNNKFITVIEYNDSLKSSIDSLNSKYYNLKSQVESFNSERMKFDNLSESAESIDSRYDNLVSTYLSTYASSDISDIKTKIEFINTKSKESTKYDPDELEDLYNSVSNKVFTQTTATDELLDKKEDKANLISTYNFSESSDEFPSAQAVIDAANSLFDYVYPVGSIYISADGTAPALGTWEKLQSGIVLWNTDNGGLEYLEPTLPNVKGTVGSNWTASGVGGPFYVVNGNSKKTGGSKYSYYNITMDLSKANPIYSDSATTVQPPSLTVTMYIRTE